MQKEKKTGRQKASRGEPLAALAKGKKAEGKRQGKRKAKAKRKR